MDQNKISDNHPLDSLPDNLRVGVSNPVPNPIQPSPLPNTQPGDPPVHTKPNMTLVGGILLLALIMAGVGVYFALSAHKKNTKNNLPVTTSAQFSTTKLFTLNPGEELDNSVLFWPPLKSYFTTVSTQYAVANGIKTPQYKHISQFSYNFKLGHVGFIAERTDGTNALVYNGKEQSTPFTDIYDLTLPEQGLTPRYAFIAKQGEQELVVVDGKPGKLYEAIGRTEFTEDGSQIIYEAIDNGISKIVVGTKEIGSYHSVSLVPASWAGGNRIAYEAQDKCDTSYSSDPCPTFVVIDGKEGNRYDRLAEFSTRTSPDNKHFVYVGIKGDKKTLVTDGVEGPWYDSINGKIESYYSNFFSVTGGHIMYVAQRGTEYFVVKDGKEGKSYKFINHLDASLDGSHITFLASQTCNEDQILETSYQGTNGNPCKVMIVKDDKESIPKFTPVGTTMNHDSTKVAYIAVTNCQGGEKMEEFPVCSSFVVNDGKPGKEYTQIMGTPRYSPKGKHLAYAAGDVRNNTYTLVIDEVEYPLRDISGIDTILSTIFTPDDEHIILLLPKDGKLELWIDGQKMQTHDKIYDAVFTEDGKTYYYMYQDGLDVYLGSYTF